jgi:hypothetical protein
LEEWAAWRTRDLAPTRSRKEEQSWREMLARIGGRKYVVVESGMASRFLEFL